MRNRGFVDGKTTAAPKGAWGARGTAGVACGSQGHRTFVPVPEGGHDEEADGLV